MMERMGDVGYGGMVGRFRPEQIAQMTTWSKIPEGTEPFADMHVIHVVPANGSTETQINPVEPGDGYYLEKPYTWPNDKYSSAKGRPGFY